MQTIWHNNGHKRLEVLAKNGLRNGPWTEWYEDGKLRAQGNYVNDQLDGKLQFFHPSGAKWAERSYHEGQRDGEWIEWDESGKELERTRYNHGVPVGEAGDRESGIPVPESQTDSKSKTSQLAPRPSHLRLSPISSSAAA
jgi:hypothetical protein